MNTLTRITQFFFTAYTALPHYFARESQRIQAIIVPITGRGASDCAPPFEHSISRLYLIISEQPSFFNAELKYFPSGMGKAPCAERKTAHPAALNTLNKRQGGHNIR